MNCPTCGSSQFSLNENMAHVCEYCLVSLQNVRFEEFLSSFKSAYLSKDDLTEIINSYSDVTDRLRFPFIIRDFVNSGFNQSVISNSLNSLPLYEKAKLKEIIADAGEFKYNFESSLEFYNYLYEAQDETNDTLDELEFLLLIIANEIGSTQYQSLSDLDLIAYDPKIGIIEKKFLGFFETFSASYKRRNTAIIKKLSKLVKTYQIYFEGSTISGSFSIREQGNDCFITKVKSKQTKLIIPPIIKGKVVKGFDENSIESLEATLIEFPLTVNTIDESVIQDCRKLEYVKLMGATTFSGYSFRNSNEIKVVDVEKSTAYKSIDGVIFDNSLTKLIYFPSALTKASLNVPNNVRVTSYSCFNARYLREVTLGEGIILEDEAFRIDDQSLLDPSSIIKINEVKQKGKSSTIVGLDSINLKEISQSSAELLVERNSIQTISDLLAILDRFEVSEQVNMLAGFYENATNDRDKSQVLEHLYQTNLGREKILSLKITNPKDFYFPAKVMYEKPEPDYEAIVQMFLDSFGAGNYRSGLNASIMLKKGEGIQQDLLYAERILIELSDKNMPEADLRLLTLYYQYPQLVDSSPNTFDIFELIERLDATNPKGYQELKADMLFSGKLIERDIIQAIFIYDDLVNMNNANAAYQLGYIYSMEDDFIDYKKAILYFQNAYNLGRKDALRQIDKVRSIMVQEDQS